ncbi:MAG: hypothetical protein WC241_04580, partial [Candidatus Paceibacterota bacterium]
SQGATITSAKITFVALRTATPTLTIKIEGIDEDNTAEFVISPHDVGRDRTKTTANVSWSSISETADANLDTPDIKDIVQEIINRGSWSSGNAMGFYFSDGGGTASGNYIGVREYSDGAPPRQAILTIVYDDGTTSTSSSTSTTSTSSSTISTSSSTTVSTTSTSTTTLPLEFIGIKISKPGKDVLKTNMPDDLIFSSEYGTLKYFLTDTLTISTTIDELEDIEVAVYNHNLGYYPYFEAYVLNWDNNWQPIPIIHLGASTSTDYNVYITKTQLRFRVKWTAYTIGTTQTAIFKFFIFKNNLNL